ncbi:DUF6119 family protein [Chryseobacterium taklimakanense]|uniref:Sporadically distributed protein, TIGR04141 family n=1 Tax=Chryseobacterium taklimakanense TaxID=536441 RepID=A0A3G8WIN7_9FLAO|nr:DUF6119 family protein [Chryseobacterium taklimakanense]AZI20148.1 hypothetical protein EIH08_04930 [Chryseobacterium taklimakanense]
MDNDELKNYKLSIYLLKEDVINFQEALKSNISKSEYQLKKDIKAEGLVIIGATKESTPNWKNLLQEGTASTLPDITNSSSRAIVFFKINNRIFAIPFGYGKHLLKEECIEREFGLRTALNIINADKLISVDKANIGDMSLLTKMQTSQKGAPDLFNIDTIKDLLKSITGEPSLILPEQYGNIITGNEAVYINPKTEFTKIPEILSKLEEDYRKETYKARFDWIDNIRIERNPQIIDRLQNQLVADLKAQNSDKIHLAPPFLINWEEFEFVTFTPKGEEYTEFSIENFYEVKNDLNDLDWAKFIRQRFYLKNSHYNESFGYPLWRAINYQTELENRQYVFTLSNWYQVDNDYYKAIYEYCRRIPESKTLFINCDEDDDEGTYNIKLADSCDDLLLFDKNLIKSRLSRSSIEACDVFNKVESEFIHVKFRGSSATLSHLFAQGRISANSLQRDEDFRKDLRNKLKADRELVPIKFKDFDANDYTITFAVIESKSRSFVDALPFFSLINFRMTAEDLIMLGFKVCVKKILIT